MASLRKKPVADVVSAPDPPPALEAAIETSPAPPSVEPSPEPVAQPQDDAGAALLAQVELVRQQEALAQAAQLRNDWVKSSPLAQQHYAALNDFHREAVQAGIPDASAQYFQFLDERLAALDAQRPEVAATHLVQEMQQRAAQLRPQEQQPKPTRLSPAHVSAPVSREVPTASGIPRAGRITLTIEQREAARLSGVSEAEYAKQLLRLRELQASGEYSDRR